MSATAHRLFFALWPDEAARQALVGWQTHNLAGDLRWRHRADLHMTLHFLGRSTTRGRTACGISAHRCGDRRSAWSSTR